jgi:hypothetical protein
MTSARPPSCFQTSPPTAQAVAVATLVCALWLDVVSIVHLECADHVDHVWTDLRPRSLREPMTAGHQ